MTYDYSKRSEIQAYDAAREQVSKTRQIVMLYDGIVSFLLRSKEALINNNYQDQYNFIDRANKIINGLLLSLDKENGGEVANVLEKYYTDLLLRVMRLIPARDPAAYDAVVEDVRKMREAWEQIDREHCQEEGKNTVVRGGEESLNEQNLETAIPEGISLSA